MSTIDSVVTRMREDHLSDPDGRLFLTARCFRWANDAHREVQVHLRQFRGVRAQTETEDFSIAANTETFDLAGLTRPFRALRTLWYVPANGTPVPLEPIPDGQEEEWKQGAGASVAPDVAPRYYLRSEGTTSYLHALPLANATRNYRAHYEYGTADLTTGQSLATPVDYDGLVAALGAQRALRSKQQRNEELEAFIESRWRDLEEDFASAAATSRPRYMRDDSDFFR